MKCPFCGSEHVQYVSHTTRTNFGGLQACCGFILMGPMGLLCGLCGQSESTSEYWVCHDCGNTFPTFMGTWKMQRENNKEEHRKQQEALRQKERDQYYSNKVYLSPLANAEGTYSEALKAYEKAVSERVFYEKKRRDVLIRLQKHPERKVRRAAKNQQGGMDVLPWFLCPILIIVGLLRFSDYLDGVLLIILGILGLIITVKKNSNSERFLCYRFPAYQRLTRTIEELTAKTKRMEFTIDKIKQVEQYEKKYPHEISAPEPAVPEGSDLSQDDDAWFRQWLSSEGGSEF